MVTLMEGCFASELTRHTSKPMDHTPLWSASFLYTDRNACLEAHKSLVRGGVDLIYTGSYQATVPGLIEHLRLTEGQARNVISDSVVLCRQAIEEVIKSKGDTGRVVKVAGSVGPYGAYLHDGSEYTGSYKAIDKEFLKQWHRSRIEALLDAKPDYLGFETIPCLVEALALVELLNEYKSVKGLLAFSCNEVGKISSGEDWVEAAGKCWEAAKGNLIAIGLNCCHPDLISPQMKLLHQKHPQIPRLVYPNSGETYDKESGRWIDGSNRKMVTDYSDEWLDQGIEYIGGCCRTYALDMAEFRKCINGHTKKTSS